MKKIRPLIISVLIAVFALCMVLLFPVLQYHMAEKAYEIGDYEQARMHYMKAQSYQDSEDKAVLCEKGMCYQTGIDAYDAGDYVRALEYLMLANEFADATEWIKKASYMMGEQIIHTEILEYDLQNEFSSILPSYLKAAEYFDKADDYENSNEQLLWLGKELITYSQYDAAIDILSMAEDELCKAYTYYAKGLQFRDSKAYTRAKDQLKLASRFGVEEAEDWYWLCEISIAEEYFSKGKLSEAKRRFEAIPAKYLGCGVSDYLKRINNFAEYVDICGTWRSTEGYTTKVIKYSNDSRSQWNSWTGTVTDVLDMTVRCYIRGDDTVDLQLFMPIQRFLYWEDYSKDLVIEEINSEIKCENIKLNSDGTFVYRIVDGEIENGDGYLHYPYVTADENKYKYLFDGVTVVVAFTGETFEASYTFEDEDFLAGCDIVYTFDAVFHRE